MAKARVEEATALASRVVVAGWVVAAAMLAVALAVGLASLGSIGSVSWCPILPMHLFVAQRLEASADPTIE